MSKTRHYKSVLEMVRDVSEDRAFAETLERRVAQRQIVKSLFALRSSKGLSQKDLAQKLGCTQSRISKLETGDDDDLRIGDLDRYLTALGLDVCLLVTPRHRMAIAMVKHHALAIKRLLDRLADLARGDNQIARGVAGFFGEAFFNLVKMLQDSSSRLPKNEGERPYIQIELGEMEPEAPLNRNPEQASEESHEVSTDTGSRGKRKRGQNSFASVQSCVPTGNTRKEF